MTKGSPYRFWLNLLLAGTAAGFVGFIVYRLVFALNYTWNWSVIPT